ncbi:MAG TPA: recombinase family protein [Caldimonas sp.]|jgi:DNA invertase Pin-like site-specific DNA recombinase|nr:recombinase family protein [Caldimonas sp.]HEX2541512.1 recombinase family protein [Caldimonas sp.]
MTAHSGFAAQYIRMSTDRQDLSPVTQKEAIAAYAAAKGLEVVATYEDDGRSGVHLKNRPPC